MLGNFLKSVFGSSQISEFPPNPVDGQEYTDSENVKWRYYTNTKQWIRLVHNKELKKTCRHTCGCHDSSGTAMVDSTPAEVSLVELVDLENDDDSKQNDTNGYVMGVDHATPGADRTVVMMSSMPDVVIPAVTITSMPDSYSTQVTETPSPTSDPSPSCGGSDYSGACGD